MSGGTFSRAICRTCGEKWALPRTYAEPELYANFNAGDRLSLCPRAACKSIQISFPFDRPEDAPESPVILAAEEDVFAEAIEIPDPDAGLEPGGDL